MDAVPVRELQQHASAVLRRVRNGQRVAVTDRGTIVAILVPPSDAGGAAQLLASGRVRRATAPLAAGAAARPRVDVDTAALLDELRSDAG